MRDSRSTGPLARFMPGADEATPDRTSGTGAPAPLGAVGVDYAGEVVESSTIELVAEARQLNGAPAFGSFVRIESDMRSVGIVYNTATHSLDPTRRPTAYGRSEEELRAEQPQIFELLRTHFHVLVIAYLDGDAPIHLLPPQPARIHSFVYPCDESLILQCSQGEEFLRSILQASRVPTDELLVASVRQALAARGFDRRYLVEVGKEISRLLRDDYDRLSSVVRRIASVAGLGVSERGTG